MVIDRTKGVEPMIVQKRYCSKCGESIFSHNLAFNPEKWQYEPVGKCPQ